MTKQNPHEIFCLDNAIAFTAVRGFGGKRIRTEHATRAEAEAEALRYGDGRTMIYAITKAGNSAHICNA
jgi:hypothetical protein